MLIIYNVIIEYIYLPHTGRMAMLPLPPAKKLHTRRRDLASTGSDSPVLMINGMRLIGTLHGSKSMTVKVVSYFKVTTNIGMCFLNSTA